MLEGFKQLTRRAVTSLALTNRLYLKRRMYPYPMDEKTIRGKLQHLGHGMDLRLSSNRPVARTFIWEFEFFLDQIARKDIAIDEPLFWAFSVYVAAKHGLGPQYRSGMARTSQKQAGHNPEIGLLDAVVKRRSVRRWKPEPVEPADLERIVELARWAPSSCNRQLWKVLVVDTDSDKQFLTGYFANTFWLQAPVLAVILMDSTIYGSNEKHYAYLDGAAFIQNMLLLAEAFGYGACWIGFKGWDTLGNVFMPAERCDEFYRHFDLKRLLVPVSMIALGRPEVVPRVPPRQGVGTILTKSGVR